MGRHLLIKGILNEVVNPEPIRVILNHTFTVWNTIHGEEQMCCRPTCFQKPSYRGCYKQNEDSTPISEKEATKVIQLNESLIANNIANNKFKPLFHLDPKQKLARISANFGNNPINRIFLLMSLITESYPNNIISPFQFTLRIETARRTQLTVDKEVLILNEVTLNHQDRTKILFQFDKPIMTNFKVNFNEIANDKIVNVGLIINDQHIQTIYKFYGYIKLKINDILSEFKENELINYYVDNENELTIAYNITRDSLRDTVSNTGNINIPTRSWNVYNFNVLDIKASYH